MDTKNKIQEIATSLFSELGYENCSVDRIAQEAGVSKGAVYYCFKSKADILYAIVESGIRELENDVSRQLRQSANSVIAFENAVVSYVDLFFYNRDLCIIVMRDLLCTKNNISQEKITALTDKLFSFTAVMIREGQNEGIVNLTEAKILARTVCAVLYGFLLFPGSGDRNEAILTVKNILRK